MTSRLPDWLRIAGPGAVIASLTIGAGELIFSTRAGALFGFRPLWLFLAVLAIKWCLVYGSARHLLLTGRHPFERWFQLPGPRGWLPFTFLILAALCFPIWIAFHAGTLGTLIAHLTGTAGVFRDAGHLVWGLICLAGCTWLSLLGGYQTLEKIQTGVIVVMLLAVVASLVLLQPDWLGMAKGLIVPQPLRYPEWLNSTGYQTILNRPEWVEAITYVGVIGGSSYDYLAYVAFAREKGWMLNPVSSPDSIGSAGRSTEARRLTRILLTDTLFSFGAVLLFTLVFVACGATVLGPKHLVPEGQNLLTLQSQFLSPLVPALTPLYYIGAILAIGGTLYGTIEVAPTVLAEFKRGIRQNPGSRMESPNASPNHRRLALQWSGGGGLLVLLIMAAIHWHRGAGSPPELVALLTPANLFTGVMGCGIVCGLNLWMDHRFAAPGERMPSVVRIGNMIGAAGMMALGCKGYYDHGGWGAAGLLAATLAAGLIAAWIAERKTSPASP